MDRGTHGTEQGGGLPPAIEDALRHMRQAITNMPEYLLETFGGPTSQGEHVLADFYGFDDELVVGGMRLPKSEPVWLMPIRQRLTLVAEPPVSPMMRTAQYDRLSCFATYSVDPMYAPGWTYDMQSHLVNLMLVRYRRTR